MVDSGAAGEQRRRAYRGESPASTSCGLATAEGDYSQTFRAAK